MFTGEVKIIEGSLMDFLLPSCGATRFDVDSISILNVLRGAKKFLTEQQVLNCLVVGSWHNGFSLFLLITDWNTAPLSVVVSFPATRFS
jgi:hypothetical protein